MRVHELAKELGISSKEMLDRLQKLGHKPKGPMSSLEEKVVEQVRAKVSAPKAKEKRAPKQETPAVTPLPEITVPEIAAPSAEIISKEEELEEEVPKKDLAKIVGDTKDKKHLRDKPPVSAKESHKPDAEDKEPPKIQKITPQVTSTVLGKKTLELRSPVVVKDLAEKLGLKPNELIAKLISLGVFASINQNLDEETANRVAHEYGCELVIAKKEPQSSVKQEISSEFQVESDKPEDLLPRSPIATFMGHVDHGKTSLLDYIRKTRVTAKEAGGITQHIGAYEVAIPKGKITFLDTPGHKAFTAMRARGAKITDIVVLVVAADDGVMPQTKEAIDHCRDASVPIMVAVNKADLPNAAPEKVRRQLAELGLQPEEWGGETIFVDVSAKSGQGIDHLLEMLVLQAELLELKANANRSANGVVIEAKLTKGRGPAVTVLVKNGTLKVGDPILCGVHSGKVKALVNDAGEAVRQAGPSTPVEILGLDGVPEAGAEFYVTRDEKEAKVLSEVRKAQNREKSWGEVKHTTLEDLYREIVEGEVKELKLIIKGDVQGSVEALVKSLEDLAAKKVAVKVVHAMVGDISETDVMLASASNAVILGFHCKTDAKIRDIAKKEAVEIRTYNIIYDAVEDIRKAMEGMLEPKLEEIVIGHAHVRQIFDLSKAGKIAGCLVKDGKIVRNGKVRLLREGQTIYQGEINALKRFKEEVKEVKVDFECGIKLAGWDDIAVGDIIEAFIIEKTAQVL